MRKRSLVAAVVLAIMIVILSTGIAVAGKVPTAVTGGSVSYSSTQYNGITNVNVYSYSFTFAGRPFARRTVCTRQDGTTYTYGTVQFTRDQLAAGTVNDIITATADAPITSVTIQLLDRKSAVLASSTFTVTNNPSAP